MFQKLRHSFVVLRLAGFVFQPALAENLNQNDMAFAFGDSATGSESG